MKATTEKNPKTTKRETTPDYGIQLDVLGRAIIAQADELSRRTDLQTKIDGHLEYARFLDFIRRNVVRNRRYRLALGDLSLLEIMPKGTYW